MTRVLSVASLIIALVLGAACLALATMTLGGLALGPSDGGPPPYLRLLGFLTYSAALGAASYEATTYASRPLGLPIPTRCLLSLPLAAGAVYFALFYAFAPWNMVALLLSAPGLLALGWTWRRLLFARSAA